MTSHLPNVAPIDPRIIGFWKRVDSFPLTTIEEYRADGTLIQYVQDWEVGKPLPGKPSPFRTEGDHIISSAEMPDGSIVEVKIPYAISGDTLTMTYSSKNPTHCVRTDEIVVTAEDEIHIREKEIRTQAIRRASEVILDRLLAGCSEAEFDSLQCHVCSGPLFLNVHPNLHNFSIRCIANVMHFFTYGTTKEVPAWWRSRVSGGWV